MLLRMVQKLLGRSIVSDPRVCYEKPTFRGTRVLVSQVLEQVAAGMAWETIAGEWRGDVPKEAELMTITLDLAPDVEAFLRNQATHRGQDVEAVAQAILAEAMVRDVVSRPGVSLSEYGISPAQATELRASFATFASEWERPEMDVYDDYDAAKTLL